MPSMTPPAVIPPAATPPPVAPYVPGPEVHFPDTSLLVTDDGAAVESLFAEKQQRLLVEPLYGSWTPADGRPFRAMANVGLFHAYKEPPNVPDAMLALGVPPSDGILEYDNRSYFMWIVAKPPDVVIEVVSDTRGGEDTRKLKHYASIGVTYYAIFDPELHLRNGVLRVFVLNDGEYVPTDPAKLKMVGLGLLLWNGEYEGEKATWLRWADAEGNVIPTTKERADRLEERAESAEERAETAEQVAAQERRKTARAEERAKKAEEAAQAEAAALQAKIKELEARLAGS